MLNKVRFTFGLILLISFVAYAQVPQLINYQGILTDAAGNPITGTPSIQFNIYNSDVGGTALWTETQAVPVADGLLHVLLGSITPIPYNVFDGNDKFLALKVGSDPEMAPRKRLISVGYAYRAYDTDKVDGQELSANDGTVNQSGDPVSWYKIKDMPAGFADGNDDVGAAGGISQINVGTGMSVTNPTGPTATLGLKMGHGNNINADMVDGKHASQLGADNLGNHLATTNIKLNNHWLSNDGGNEGILIGNTGVVSTSNDIHVKNGSNVIVDGYVKAGTHIKTGTPSSAYGTGDIAATDELVADSNVRATGGHIRTGTPSSSYGNGDITATSDVIADNKVIGHTGVEGYGGTYGVYGKKGSNYGYLGETNVGVGGQASGSSRGVYGTHAGGNWGQFGTSSYGAFGRSGNNWGYLGYSNHGVGGRATGSNGRAVYGEHTSGNWGQFGTATYGCFGRSSGSSSHFAGKFWGKVDIVGTLSKSAGGFKIDHPLDPANKYLHHSFVESPDMKNVYDGVVVLDANGEAAVELPEWFDKLNKDFRYQLTAIGRPGPNLYIADEIISNRFRVAGGSPGMKVSWQVTGIRNDAFAIAHRIPIEEIKVGKERGKYLYPKEFGLPETMGIELEDMRKIDIKILEDTEKISPEK